jgi:hypothetical protein
MIVGLLRGSEEQKPSHVSINLSSASSAGLDEVWCLGIRGVVESQTHVAFLPRFLLIQGKPVQWFTGLTGTLSMFTTPSLT